MISMFMIVFSKPVQATNRVNYGTEGASINSIGNKVAYSGYLSEGASGNFYINATGNPGLLYDRLWITTYASSNGLTASVTVYDPKGNIWVDSHILNGGETLKIAKKVHYTGNYRIHYEVYTGSTYMAAEFTP